MAKTALIIVDMVRDFTDPEGLVFYPENQKILPRIKKVLDESRKHELLIVFLQHCNRKDKVDKKAQSMRPNCIEGTFGIEIDPMLEVDEKKDYENFPSLSDYIDTDFPDIRDYVNFDMFQDLDGISDFLKAVVEFLWNAFTGFFRWLWAALKFVFFNFLGIFEWLGKCLWTIVKNIGIALYNLVVDLKKLVTYLFVPNSKDLNVAIESKFPAYAKLRKAFQQGKQSSSNSVTFTLFGKDFDFNMNSAPNELKSALFNASTIAMYAICIYATIKALFRCFGIQLHESSESEGE